MELNLYFKYLYDGINLKPSLKLLLEFRTHSYIIIFIFDVLVYVISFFMGFFVLILYYKDIKLYSFLKNTIIEKYNFYYIEYFCSIINIKILIIFIILLFIILIIFLMYKKKNKNEFWFWLRKMLYYRINFLINFYIFLKLFNINIENFIEYNIIIIIIFIIYNIIQILGFFLKKKFKFVLLHYLNLPLMSIFFWIFLYLNISNLIVFELLYNEFVGYDDKYYDFVYKNLKNNDTIIISEKRC